MKTRIKCACGGLCEGECRKEHLFKNRKNGLPYCPAADPESEVLKEMRQK